MPTPSPHWPLESLRLTVEDMVLRPICDADLDPLTEALTDDIEMNPATPRPFGLAERDARAVALRQEHWRTLATWSPDDWDLGFVVERHGDILGMQSLEGRGFRTVRTVETASWLAAHHRGRGVGTLARTAVLALAFEGLGARVAITEAWQDNHASLGVSTRVGYRPNGAAPHERDGGVDEMLHLRMNLDDWRAQQRPAVVIEGLDACLPWFVGAESGDVAGRATNRR